MISDGLDLFMAVVTGLEMAAIVSNDVNYGWRGRASIRNWMPSICASTLRMLTPDPSALCCHSCMRHWGLEWSLAPRLGLGMPHKAHAFGGSLRGLAPAGHILGCLKTLENHARLAKIRKRDGQAQLYTLVTNA
eukprot:365861-Chlamydomonas_euryale.AAC.42